MPDQIAAIHVNSNPFLQDLSLSIQLNKTETVRIRPIDFMEEAFFTATQNLGTGGSQEHPGTNRPDTGSPTNMNS